MEEENTLSVGKLTFIADQFFLKGLGLNRAQDSQGFLIMQVLREILLSQDSNLCSFITKYILIINRLYYKLRQENIFKKICT